jgi:DNA-binding response OmpR family regulator
VNHIVITEQQYQKGCIAMTYIIIVEDNPTLRENITFELEMHGYQVASASDGKEALTLLQWAESIPDLIVSDIAMPDMNGYEFLETVRKNEQWNAIPVIFLTAFDSSNAIRLGKELGVDDYLVKPFDPEDLMLAIKNKLQRQSQIQRQAERNLDETRRDLINLIAHELRTPMTSVQGGIDILEYSLKNVSDNTTQEMLDLINAGTKRLHHLINRVILMVQIESGHLQRMMETHCLDINLNELMLTDLSYFDIEKRKDVVQAQFTDYTKPIRGVSNYLKSAIFEFVDNAVK